MVRGSVQTQLRALREALEAAGWRILEESSDTHDWLREEWTLESTASAAGAKRYLGVVLDPQLNPSTAPVMAIRGSAEPHGRQYECRSPALYLNRGWEDRMPEFIAALSALA